MLVQGRAVPCCVVLCRAEHVVLSMPRCAVQVLPRDIRVLGWTDVPEDFSARQAVVCISQFRAGQRALPQPAAACTAGMQSGPARGGWASSSRAHPEPEKVQTACASFR